MKKIVLSAITALMVTVGVYHVALLMGASEPVAATAAFAAPAVAAFVVAAFVVAAAAFTLAAVAAFALAAFALAAFAAFLAAKQEHIKFKWVFAAYGIEGLAIWGALAVGSPSWIVVIAFAGITALLTLWRAHSRFAALDAPIAALLKDR